MKRQDFNTSVEITGRIVIDMHSIELSISLNNPMGHKAMPKEHVKPCSKILMVQTYNLAYDLP
jgi:hypothetical protein